MKYNQIIIHFFIVLGVILAQAYLPAIYLSNIHFGPDITLVYLTFIAIFYGRFHAILIGFVLGLFQDMVTQASVIGLFTLIKSFSGFGLGTLFLYEKVWERKIKLSFISIMYFSHFLIYFYVVMNNAALWDKVILFTFMQATITLILFSLANIFIFKSRTL